MAHYSPPEKIIWTGRTSDETLYLHQRIKFVDLMESLVLDESHRNIALLGYQCDEGVRRNKGRVGAKEGPDAIRQMLGTFADHMDQDSHLLDCGNVICDDQDLEDVHELISLKVIQILDNGCFPILFGGGHDLAYPHFLGIKSHLIKTHSNPKIGIINLDAHFDLRKPEPFRTSGTPFYQIAQEEPEFNYLCLGIQPQVNNKNLYRSAESFGVQFLEIEHFHMQDWERISRMLLDFISHVDFVYLTVDLDGFSSAYAPGVSAPSPFGFEPSITLKIIQQIAGSGKLIAADFVELNPQYDIDNQTARLAAGVVVQLIGGRN